MIVARQAIIRQILVMNPQNSDDGFAAVLADMLRAIPKLQLAFKAYEYRHLPTICLENILLPHLIMLSNGRDDLPELKAALRWIESQADSPDAAIRNLIGNGICEPLMTTQSAHFGALFPYLGSATTALCRAQLHHFKVSAEIEQALND